MKRTNKMLKDILLFSIASFAPKLLSFFLVPLYTSRLSTEAYGIEDLLNTIYALILPVLMVDISDAIIIRTVDWRDKNNKSGSALKYGFTVYKKSILILIPFLVVISFSLSIEHIFEYCIYIFVQYSVSAVYTNLLAYLRGMDKTLIIVSASIIHSSITILLNILLILFMDFGLAGLLIASVGGALITDLYIIYQIKLIEILKKSVSVSSEEKKSMLSYSIPLIFTGIAWWINNSSDRLFISFFAGVGLNGIYAVANKIPTILSACHNIVYQAMQLSIFSERQSKDKKEYFQNLYNIYNFSITFICSIIIFFDKILASLLFKGKFYVAWKFSPALLISVVLYSVSGYLTTLYAAEGETKLIAKATITGAMVNSCLNFILIPQIGLYGAVIATLIGYFFIWLVMILNAIRVLRISLDLKISIMGYMILLIQWIILLMISEQISYILLGILILILICFNHDTVKKLLRIFSSFIKRNK